MNYHEYPDSFNDDKWTYTNEKDYDDLDSWYDDHPNIYLVEDEEDE